MLALSRGKGKGALILFVIALLILFPPLMLFPPTIAHLLQAPARLIVAVLARIT